MPIFVHFPLLWFAVYFSIWLPFLSFLLLSLFRLCLPFSSLISQYFFVFSFLIPSSTPFNFLPFIFFIFPSSSFSLLSLSTSSVGRRTRGRPEGGSYTPIHNLLPFGRPRQLREGVSHTCRRARIWWHEWGKLTWVMTRKLT